MAYSDFTLEDLENKFGIKNRYEDLKFDIQPFEPSESLKQDLILARKLPVVSEKAKSEWIVVPILKELLNASNDFFTIYSGENLHVDGEQVLKGECDFILTKNIKTVNINYPILQIVEAKKNDIDLGIPQCAAQVVGTYFFNKKKGIDINKIYGCITNGDNWLFIKLEDNTILLMKKPTTSITSPNSSMPSKPSLTTTKST